MKVDIITDRRRLDALAQEWNGLLAESAADSIFLTWEWVSTWLDVVCPNARLLVVVIRGADDRLVAVAPFYHVQMRLVGWIGYRCLRVIGDENSGGEYVDIIVRKGFEKESLPLVLQALLQRGDTWDCMWLPQVAGWTGAHERFQSLCAGGHFLTHLRPEGFSSVPLPETYGQYLQSLSRHRRWHIRHDAKKLEASHHVRLVRCEGAEALSGMLEALFVLHGKHWRSMGEPGSFARRPAMRRFYERLAPTALRLGWLRLFGLEVDGIMRAAKYGYAYKGTLFSVQGGYDPDWPGVGSVLMGRVIQACIDEGIREYDFLGGLSDYKRLWRAAPREGCSLFLGQRSARNLLLFVPRFKVWPRGRYLNQVETSGAAPPVEAPTRT